MRVFVEVAERGSLTDAADALDMSRAMVSRYLISLEQWLDARLLHRTTRRVSLTNAGEETMARCHQMLNLAQELQSLTSARRTKPRGRLRIAATVAFASSWLAPILAHFLKDNPQVQIEVVTAERAMNLVEDRIDIAIRTTNRPDPELVARRLCDVRSVLCASPAYLRARGTPRTPEDLGGHVFVTHEFVGRSEYRLLHKGKLVRVPIQSTLQSENNVAREVAVSGAGISMLPDFFVADDLRRGRLKRVLPEYEPEALGIYVLYLSRQHQPLLLRSMVDFLAAKFHGGLAPWDLAGR